MQFPNELQAAIVFDQRVDCLRTVLQTFKQVEEARSGARFNVPEAKPGSFYRLFGGGEMMITLEYCDNPPNIAVFQQALASTVTGLLCPDIRERLTRSRSHILINVSHGVLGGVAREPGIAAMLQQIGMRPEGHSLVEFRRRLDVLGLIARIVCDHAPAQVVHWTQSNQLIAGENFDMMARGEAPGPLHVHPYLFGKAQGAGGRPEVGIRTFGARHFIGHEVVVEPSSLPWATNYETIFALLRVATVENGYIIPHGDTFGPEDRSLSYRVLHRPAEADDVPIIALEPLMHRDHDFQSADYVPPERVFDDRMPPADLMPADEDEKQMLANEWREKRALAEGIGGRFEVRSRGAGGHGAPTPPTDGPPPPPRFPGFGKRVVFGRKTG